MKRVVIILMCFMLLGCSSKIKQEENLNWEGQYKKDNLVLNIDYDNEYKDGFLFSVMLDEKGIKDYADFQNNKNEAIYDVGEDGHTLKFTLEKDKVIIEESGGINYLEVELSGEYLKK